MLGVTDCDIKYKQISQTVDNKQQLYCIKSIKTARSRIEVLGINSNTGKMHKTYIELLSKMLDRTLTSD